MERGGEEGEGEGEKGGREGWRGRREGKGRRREGIRRSGETRKVEGEPVRADEQVGDTSATGERARRDETAVGHSGWLGLVG